MFLVTDNF